MMRVTVAALAMNFEVVPRDMDEDEVVKDLIRLYSPARYAIADVPCTGLLFNQPRPSLSRSRDWQTYHRPLHHCLTKSVTADAANPNPN